MQEKEHVILLKLLSEDTYITSDQLADKLTIGMWTIRKRMKDLNDILKRHGAAVEARPRYGYRLVSNVGKEGADADLVLLGPQVRLQLDSVKGFVHCPVEVIDMMAYGMMDGKKVIEQVRKTLGD